MPWSSGAFSRIFGSTGWTNDKNTAVYILSSRHDTHDQDLSDGINACLTRDGLARPAASILPNLDNTYDLGSVPFTWASIYLRTLRFVRTGFYSSFSVAALTANRSITIPDYDVALTNIAKAYKTATTSRSATTALADDPHLIIALAVGTYSFECWFPFWCTTAATGGGKFVINFSGTTTATQAGAIGCIVSVASVTPANVFNTNFNVSTPSVGTGTTSDWLQFSGTLVVTVAGNLSLQWAQLVNNLNALNVGVGGYITATRIA